MVAMPRRLLRWMLYGLGTICILGLLCVFLLWWFFPAEQVRRRIVTVLETRLERPVELGALQVRGLSLGLSELRIADDDVQAPPLFHVKSIQARLSLRHLLTGRLIIEQLLIAQPSISLVERQGRWNMITLLEALAPSGPAAPPQPKPAATSEADTLSLPIGVELTELLVQDIAIRVRRNNAVDLQLHGLTLRLAGEISQRANHLTAHLTAEPATPNVRVRLRGAQSLQTSATLRMDVKIDQRHFRTGRLAGSLALTTTDLHWQEHELPVAVRMSTEITVDLPAETVKIHHLHSVLGPRSEIKLQGEVLRFQQAPQVDVAMRDSRIDMADFQGVLQAFFPQKTLTGTLTLPHLSVRGPALAESEAPLRLDGTLTLDGVHLVDSANQLRLTDLDVTLTNLHGTVLAYEPQVLTGSLQMRLQQADVAALTVRAANIGADFALHGAALDTGKLTLDMQAQALHYQHPTYGQLMTSFDTSLTAEGNVQQGDITALQLTTRVGTWLETSLTGTVKRFGREALDLVHEATFHVEPLLESLPPALHAQLGALEGRGTIQLHTQVQGHMATVDHGTVTAHTRLRLSAPRLHSPTQAALTAVQGLLDLKATHTFPGQLQGVALQGRVALRRAEAMEQIVLNDSAVTFDLQLPAPGAKQHALQPEFTLTFRSASVEQPQLAAAFQDLTGKISVQVQLASMNLTEFAGLDLPALLSQPHAQGALRWRHSRMQELAMDRGTLDFRFSADTMHMQSSQSEVRLKAHQVRYGTLPDPVPIPALSFRLRTSQELHRGAISIKQLRLDAPDLLRLRAEAKVTNNGQAVRAKVHVSEAHLAPMLARVPVSYRSALSGFDLQGRMEMTLTVDGGLPLPDDLNLQRLPRFGLRLHLQDLAVTGSDQPFAVQDAEGTLRVTNDGKAVGLRVELGTPALTLPALDSTTPLAFKMVSNLSLHEGNRLTVHLQELHFPTHGIVATQQGHVSGLAPLLAAQSPMSLSTLVDTLSGKFTTALSLTRPERLDTLLPGVDLRGSLKYQGELTLRRRKSMRIQGRVQMDNLMASYSPLIQLSDLEGIFRFQKALTLHQGASIPRADDDARAEPSPQQGSVPRALRTQLRAYSPLRDSIVIRQMRLGPLTLSNLAFDLVLQDHAVDLQHFQAHVLDGAIAGSVRIGRGVAGSAAAGLSLSSEFAQVNLARLLPEQARIAPREGEVNGNLEMRLIFPPSSTAPVSLNALTITVHITHIGKQALDRLLLFLDPLEKNATIVNQRRLLRLATPRLLTLQLRNGLLHINTELDTPLGRKSQPLSPIPVSALEESGFPQVSELTQQLEQLRVLLQLITAQGVYIDENGHIRLY